MRSESGAMRRIYVNIFNSDIPDQLPTANTCFNQLNLPVYSSYEMLYEKLIKTFEVGIIGYGFH